MYTDIALEMASFILYSLRLPFVLPSELVRVIVQSRFQ